MTFQEIYKQLEEYGTAQNRKIYKRHGGGDNMFGVSFANLNKIKKQIKPPVGQKGKKGINHELAKQLWKTGNVDAQSLALLIADHQKMDEATIDAWKESTEFLACDMLGGLIAKTEWAEQKVKEWTASKEEYTRRIGYSVLNGLARNHLDLTNEYFETYISIIEKELQSSANRAKEAMNNCLIAIGGRNELLRDQVLKAAKTIGKVEIDHGETSCKTFVIEEYIDRIYKRKAAKAAKINSKTVDINQKINKR